MASDILPACTSPTPRSTCYRCRRGRSDLDLARLKRVIAGLGLDPLPFHAVLIGGTNGKGSVVTFTEALLAPQVRVGVRESPRFSHNRARAHLWPARA